MKKFKGIFLIFVFTGFFIQGMYAQSIKEALDLIYKEQFQKAKGILLQVKKSEPKNAEVYYYVGEIYYINEMYDSASYWYMEGIKLDKDNPLNYVGMGKITYAKDNVEGQANFDKAISLMKKDARPATYIADYFMGAEKPNPKKGLEYGLKAVETDGKFYFAKIALGDAYLGSNDGSKAMEQYKAALSSDVNSPIAMWKIGKLYLASKNYDLGMQFFKDGLAIDKNFSPIYREMGELYYRARKLDKAVESYKMYLDLRDKDDAADLRYASFLFVTEDHKGALEILKKLNAKNYDHFLVYRLSGYAQYETKAYAEALTSMQAFWKKVEARKIITQDYEYYAKILVKNNQDSLAIVNFKRALENDSTKVDLYGELGNVYFAQKDYKNTVAMYAIKVQKTKNLPKAYSLPNDYLILGRAYLLLENFVAADSAFAQVTALRKDLPIGFLYRARANAYLDPKQEKGLAKPYYEQYIELAKVDEVKNKKDLIEAYVYMGSYYYFIQKDKVKSDEAWAKVRTLDPSNKAAAEAAKLK